MRSNDLEFRAEMEQCNAIQARADSIAQKYRHHKGSNGDGIEGIEMGSASKVLGTKRGGDSEVRVSRYSRKLKEKER
jgi:hypothetical protein